MPHSAGRPLSRAEPGRFIEYRRVPGYWGRDLPVRRGFDNFETIRHESCRDEAVALEAFRSGAIDLRRKADPTRWAVRTLLREILPHGRPAPTRGFIFNTRRPLFADRRVRMALGHAVDFEWINRVLFRGAYRRTASYYPNSELAARGVPEGEELALLEPFRDRLPPALFTAPFTLPTTDGSGPRGLRRNLRTALRLLGDAGWRVRDGRLVDRAGHEFSFEVMLDDPAEEKIALEFARTLARLGITATVRTVDSAQYQGRLDAFDFDMTIRSWISTLSPGNEQLYYFGSAAADTDGSRNYPGIRSPAVDALAAGLADAPSRQTLVARARALDRVLLWGHYTIPLFHLAGDRVAYWSRLARPTVTPVYGMVIEAWWGRSDAAR